MGYLSGLGTVWAEGHPGGAELGSAASVGAASSELREWLGLHGVQVEEHPYRESGGVARLDSTVMLPMASTAEVQTFLAGIASVDVPRLKPVVYGKPAQTVALLHVNGRRTLGRGYHYEQSRGLPLGESAHLRLEDQRRFDKQARLPALIIGEQEVRGFFQRRFVPLYESSRNVKCAGLPVVGRELTERLQRGEITVGEFSRASGYVLAESAALARSVFSRATFYRRRRELRELGLVLADDFFAPVEVDLGAVLERALDEGLWGQG